MLSLLKQQPWCTQSTASKSHRTGVVKAHLQFCCTQVVLDIIWQAATLPPQGFDPVQAHLTAIKSLDTM